MPRVARIVVPGAPHHIVQRGNNRQDVFFVDDDCRAYLGFLKDKSQRYGLEVLGYCLMTNHVHLIAVPSSEESLLANASGGIVTLHRLREADRCDVLLIATRET